MIWIPLVAPGLIVFYFLFLRPALHSIPAFKTFFEEADGFWQKAWAVCGKSLTLAFAYFIQGLSWCLQWIDPIATFFGDPDMREQISEALKADPKILGYVLMGISFVTIAVKLKAMAPKDDA